jgi:hypothetical protein
LAEAPPVDGQPGATLRRRLPYLILVGLIVLRVTQSIIEFVGLDPVRQGWPAFLVAGLALLLIGGLGRLVLWWGRRHRSEPMIAGLPDELSAVGMPVAAALTGLTLPVLVAGAVICCASGSDW